MVLLMAFTGLDVPTAVQEQSQVVLMLDGSTANSLGPYTGTRYPIHIQHEGKNNVICTFAHTATEGKARTSILHGTYWWKCAVITHLSKSNRTQPRARVHDAAAAGGRPFRTQPEVQFGHISRLRGPLQPQRHNNLMGIN